jgi:pentatricopeptide repeat protein
LGEAFEIYQDLKTRGIKPNMVTFQTLLDCCVTSGHLEKGLFVFQEMTKYTSFQGEKKEKQKKFFHDLLELCYKKDSPSRACILFLTFNFLVLIYQFMKSKGLFKTDSNILPFEFVSMFISEEQEANTFLFKMRRVENPNYFPSVEETQVSGGDNLDISWLKEIVHQQVKEVTMDKNHQLKINSIFDSFPKIENEGIQKFYEESWKNLFSNFSFPTKVSTNQNLKEVQDSFFSVALDSMNEMNEEQIYEIARNYKQKVVEKNKKKSHLKWVPVIIGLDGKYFYPTELNMNKVNKSSVEQAKLQYLETLKDEEIKNEIRNNLNEMIKISWQDENGEILNGFEQ